MCTCVWISWKWRNILISERMCVTCYSLLIAINFLCQLVMQNICFVSRLCECVGLSHSGKRGSVVGLMVGQICVCVCVCLWGLTEAGRLRWNWWIRLAELSDRNITIKPSAQCLPLPALFLSLINTGIGLQFGQVLGQQGRTAQPFSPHRTRITQQNSSKKHFLLTVTHTTGSMCMWIRFCPLCGDQVSPQGY